MLRIHELVGTSGASLIATSSLVRVRDQTHLKVGLTMQRKKVRHVGTNSFYNFLRFWVTNADLRTLKLELCTDGAGDEVTKHRLYEIND